MSITQRRLFIDLDGVMADFDLYYETLYGKHPSQVDDDMMWGFIHSADRFFFNLPVCEGAPEFWDEVRHLNPIFLSACPQKNYALIAKQKHEWVRKHLCKDSLILPVRGGANKCLFLQNPGDILIDDFEKNIKPWRAMQGIGILHTDFESTRQQLEAVL
jgi:5'-nucleotidase